MEAQSCKFQIDYIFSATSATSRACWTAVGKCTDGTLRKGAWLAMPLLDGTSVALQVTQLTLGGRAVDEVDATHEGAARIQFYYDAGNLRDRLARSKVAEGTDHDPPRDR